MSIVSVASSSVLSVIKLCREAQHQFRMTTLSIRKQVDCIRSSWNDKKYDEFVQITEKCSSSLINPIEELEECIKKLQEITQIIEEYNEIHLSSGSISNNSDLMSEIPFLNIIDCNAALARDGRNEQMVNISDVDVDGILDDGFWSHHGRSEIEWQEGMSEYLDMMRDYSSGMGIDQCYDQYPHAASMFFGRDSIQLSNSGGSLVITNGRHRIAMAQRFGIRYLPAIVY